MLKGSLTDKLLNNPQKNIMCNNPFMCFRTEGENKQANPVQKVLQVNTYSFFSKIQCWQLQCSGVGRLPVNRHYITIIISQSVPNSGQKN